ncbi:MAG: gliding motility-associated C-terminal domain-containing protein [Vicingus serpentipes]|nr:gliding motility-associated C-terminal domain-containing protein [Vicingus serpentipes]
MKPLRKLLLLLPLLISFAINAAGDIQFIENKGQWPGQVNFKTDVLGGKIWLEKNKISYQFTHYPDLHANFNFSGNDSTYQHVVWAEFIGVNNEFEIIKNKRSTNYFNYFIGNDPSKWASEAYAYTDIKYTNFYNNTDFRIYEKNGHLKYDFILKPGSENNIQINFQGQDKIKTNKNGELIVYTSLGEIIEEKPYAYQVINGEKKEIPAEFILKDNVLTFSLGSYDQTKELILDPTLIFASYNGSPSDNFGMTATYDEQGNLYTGGTVFGANYPTTPGVYDPSGNFSTTNPSAASAPRYGVTDIFISKYDSSGTSLIYSTYIGGGNDFGGSEAVHSLICDTLGNLHLFGTTSSADFPISINAFQDSLKGGVLQHFYYNGSSFYNNAGTGGGTDIFVSKLNPLGSAILGSTYIGGSKNDGLNYNLSKGTYNSIAAYDSLTKNYGDQFRGEIIIDELGYIYITSSTYSTDFPIINGFQNSSGGQQDAVICKFSPNLDSLIWSSYLGGGDKDAGYSLKLNSKKEVIISGGTCSADFPATINAHTPTYQGGITDGYIGIIASDGSSLNTLTFLGTNDYDQTYFVEVDRWNNIYAISQSLGNYPVSPGVYTNPNSSQLITKFDSTLSSLEFSTVFGNGNGQINISPSAFLVDVCGNIYVSGWGANILQATPLSGMPITANAYQPTSPNGFDFYLIVLERDAKSLLYGTYFGGAISQEHVDGGTSRFDKNGIIYQSVCAGCGAGNDDFPTSSGAWSNTNNSANCNNGVFKFDFEIIPKAYFTVDNFEGCAPLTVTFTNSSNSSDRYLWNFGNNDTTSVEFNPTRTYTTPGVYTVSLLITDSICNTVDTAFQTIIVNSPITLTGGKTITTCDTAILEIFSTGGPTTFIWSSNNQFTDTLNTNLTDSSLLVLSTDSSWYYVMASKNNCSNIDSFLVLRNIPITKLKDTANCLLQEMSLFINNLSNTPVTYSWSPVSSIISGENSPSPTVNPDTTTTYFVTITSQNDSTCVINDSITVVVPNINPNDISVWSDRDTLYEGEGTLLHVLPDSGFSYIWTPNLFMDNPTSGTPFVTPTSTTSYTVLLKETSSNCSYSRGVTIYIYEIICGEPDVFIPNAFTPNADGENDVLFVRGKNVEKMLLRIYDRWGELVFESNNQKDGWNGTYKGNLVEPAVFIYYLTVTCIDEQEYFKKGNITVIR